jgi:superfamily I DNA/RNA helicase
VLVARAGWLLARGEAAAEQILLLAFGRQAAQEMDERIRERLASDDIRAYLPLAGAAYYSAGQQKSAHHQ